MVVNQTDVVARRSIHHSSSGLDGGAGHPIFEGDAVKFSKGRPMAALERFFGGTPGAVLARLAVMSVVVGVILSTIGIHPYQLVASIQRLVVRIYNMGFDAIEWLFGYFWLGALVVVPIWVISRIWTVYISHDRRNGFDDLADTSHSKPGAP